MLKRALFGGERLLRFAPPQQLFGGEHLTRRPGERFRDDFEAGVHLRDAPTADPAGEGLHLLTQATLGEGKCSQVLLVLFLGILIAIANHLEGGGDDLALPPRKRLVQAGGAGGAHATLVRLAELPVEGTHLDEVDIGRGHMWPADAIVVDGASVIGDEVAWLELYLLEEEGVAGRELLA